MSIIQATEDKLASILFLDRKLEEYPEPYRGNSDIEIRVSFDTYKAFIRDYLEINDYLATPTPKLKYFLRSGNDDALYRCFYLDMAYAVAKEIWYTDIAGSPTNITHVIPDSNIFNAEFIAGLCEIYPKGISRAQNNLIASLRNANYPMPPSKVAKFLSELRYASLLYAMSSFNGEYDVAFYKWSFERRICDDSERDSL